MGSQVKVCTVVHFCWIQKYQFTLYSMSAGLFAKVA